MAVTARTRTTTSEEEAFPPKVARLQTKQEHNYTDGESDEFEFGGSLGAASLMIGFPLLMWYMWIGATYYDGDLPLPDANQTWGDFVYHLLNLVIEGAYPTSKAWAIYWTFFIAEALMRVATLHEASSLANIYKVLLYAWCPRPWKATSTRGWEATSILLLGLYQLVHHSPCCCHTSHYWGISFVHNHRRVWLHHDSSDPLWVFEQYHRLPSSNCPGSDLPIDRVSYI